MKISRTRLPSVVTSTALGLVITLGAATGYAGETKHDQGTMAADKHYTSPENVSDNVEARAEDQMSDVSDATRNAWQHGKLEGTLLLNRHLNNFTIDSEVKDGVATLSGTVESEVDRELAKQVALSIDGITEVENNLEIDRDNAHRNTDSEADAERSFAQRIDDATTTAAVKTKLLANGQTEGLEINVDTMNNHVTLRGEVDSSAEKMLAQQIAANTDDVLSVSNQLVIDEDDDKEEEAE